MNAELAPVISVIVPAYNVEDYLPECLDSVLAQTFRDFEIVLIDDGSTDTTPAIADRYASAHPGVIRSLHKPNGGLSDARNHGIDLARGEFLAFVDGDDLITVDMLEKLHARAIATGADLVLCGMENFIDHQAAGDFYPEPDMRVFGHSLAEEPRLIYRVDASACDKLYARELFADAGMRFPVGRYFEDVPVTYRLVAGSKRIEKVDEPLYRYRRQRSDSISGDYGARYLDLIESFRDVLDAYIAEGRFAGNRDGLLRLSLTHLIAGRYPDLFARASGRDVGRFMDAAFSLLRDRFGAWERSAVCRDLWRNPVLRFVSTHRWALEAFCSLPDRLYQAALVRLGAFDPWR
ncbi:MAG: glycosyltransferase [Coriobacteriia bacterium]|nr:glycosyltransferase [Coriobacteriia bacterium]